MGKPMKVWNVMTDTSCGVEALYPGGACVNVCSSNLSGRDDVSHFMEKVKDVCVST